MLRIISFVLILFFACSYLHAQQVIINEIMFAPETNDAEWVELFNCGEHPVNLRGWTLTDRSTVVALLSAEDVVLPPGGYVVIAQFLPLGPQWPSLPATALIPAAFPTLNNTGDDIILRNAEGRTIDSLAYTASWSSQRGVSAERLLATVPPLRENWAASIAIQGGTPGERNSVSIAQADPLPRYSLVFNEIMPDPLSGSCEWIELYNTAHMPVDLSRWSLAGKADASGKRSRILLPAGIGEISPGCFAVIAADSGILADFTSRELPPDVPLVILNRSSLGLGNTADEWLLLDALGNTIDSIVYDKSWHHPFRTNGHGLSLELMHPAYHHLGASAWSSCTDPAGGTPARQNSIYSTLPPEATGDAISLTVSPNPFSPDSDGVEDFCLFRCRLPDGVNQVRLRIYDVAGRHIVTLRNNTGMGREGMVVWDGLDDAGRRVRIGSYIALLEALDPTSNTVGAAKTVVVVARPL
ncbi:MAG: lamin tail domain-containing protein [Bacteroidetes bacterium]|nr:lamin tail domain-containing protein [Bacteroidota bacterium]